LCARPPPLDRRQARECEEALARLLQAVGDGATLGAPVAKKGLAACFNAGVTAIARSGLHRTEFLAKAVLDERANALANPVSVGSIQPSKRCEKHSLADCKSSGFVVMLVIA
jgi:hypothetical protein